MVRQGEASDMSSETTQATGDRPKELRKPGLTLIEVLVTLIILGAIGGILLHRHAHRRWEALKTQVFALAQNGQWRLVEELVAKHPELARVEEYRPRTDDKDLGIAPGTLLHSAASHGRTEMCRMLARSLSLDVMGMSRRLQIEQGGRGG